MGKPAQHVCPWWLCYMFDNPLRLLLHNPEEMLKPYIQSGWTAADIGCGMGYFSIAMAKLVGANGRVMAIDLQAQMLAGVVRRSTRRGLSTRIQTHQCAHDRLGISEPLDFALAFWMAHEVPDRDRFFGEIYTTLKPGAKFLLVEPRLHTSTASYKNITAEATAAGLKPEQEPKIALSRAMLFSR